MAKYHISEDGVTRPCKASVRECALGLGEGSHFEASSVDEAKAMAEKINESKHGSEAQGMKKQTKKVKYSFMKEFKEKEQRFKEGFDGVPSRFFNADLLGKNKNVLFGVVQAFKDTQVPHLTPEERAKADKIYASRKYSVFLKSNDINARLATAMSSPGDNQASQEDVTNAFLALGADEVRVSEDGQTFYAAFGDEQVVANRQKRNQLFGYYAYRVQPENAFAQNFLNSDVRSIIGFARLEKKGKIQGNFKNFMESRFAKRDGKRGSPEENATNTLLAVHTALQAQSEGKNFLLQKKHVKESSGAIATAYMDKKNPDQTRQEMMKNTVLNKYFSKVEIDNDVDPEDRRPELRIRKLGKHKADGMYFPHKNTIAIDVRDSSAFVHEYGHYLDFTVKSNQSLSQEFSGVVKDYSQDLRLPDNMSADKKDYYITPTEVHSRAFEIYAHEHLGIDNKTINPERFESFDYKPFKDNPQMKQAAFDFFDKVFAENKQG